MTNQTKEIISVLESYGFQLCKGSQTVYTLDRGYNQRLMVDVWAINFFQDNDDIYFVLYDGLQIAGEYCLSSEPSILDNQLLDMLV